ncbi:4-nitrophenylphosphatase [Sergentomyia squamirostris]
MNKVPHILELTEEESFRFLNSFDIIMSDCDGVLWCALCDLPGVGDAINALELSGKKIVFVSNNSTRPMMEYERKFKKLGVELKYENLVHPMLSIIYYLKKMNYQGLSYVIGTTHSKNLLREAGFKVLDGPNGEVDENYAKLFRTIHDCEPVNLVIFDCDLNFNYAKFLRGYLYLQARDCQLIISANDASVPLTHDFHIPGPKPFMDAMLQALPPGKKPIVLGKPGEALGDILKEQYKVQDPKRVLFVGDMLSTDIKFAKMAGFQSLLVLTGGTSRETMLANKDDSLIPDLYADSFADLYRIIRKI